MRSIPNTLKSWKAGILAGCPKIDPSLLSHSRAARLGLFFIKAVYIAKAIEFVVLIASAILLSAVEVMAQQPGGNIFGSDQQVGNAIREAIKWGRNLLFLMGVVFVGWGVINY